MKNYIDIMYKFYGTKCADRSKVPYIVHLLEGLNVLDEIGASENAKKAFLLHPVFQNDADLVQSIQNQDLLAQIEPQIIVLCMEYRKVANAYLSKREISSIDEIELSPLKDVRDMLVADKIQNYKDFLSYQQTHPRHGELDRYFKNWLERLGQTANIDLLVGACAKNFAVTIRFENEGEYLLLNRYSHDRTMAGRCHPGGKVDFGETIFEALAREVKEEINIELDLSAVRFFDWFSVQTRKGDIKTVLTFETTQWIKDELILNTDEFESFNWVSKEEWDVFWNEY